MPAIREALKTILNKNTLDNHENQQKVFAALDALLKAEDTDQFKEGLRNHSGFWEPLLAGEGAQKKLDKKFKIEDDFDELVDLAARKREALIFIRIFLALSSAKEEQLSEIIMQATGTPDEQKAFRQKFFDDAGKSLFGEPEITIPNWKPDEDEFLYNAGFDLLKQQAQQQLLIKKINTCDNKALLDSLLESRTSIAFTEAVKTLFGVPLAVPRPEHPLAQSFLFDPLFNNHDNNPIVKAAANKGFSLAVEKLTDKMVLEDHGLETLTADDEDFKERFIDETSAQKIDDNDIDTIRGQLGARFLPLIAPKIIGHVAAMEAVAKCEDPAQAIALVKAIPGLGHNFVDHSVTATSLPAIRQAFAKQVLLQKIALCNDGPTLEALTKLTNAASLTDLLKTKPALGHSADAGTKFRDALANIPAQELIPLVAAAHIRMSIRVSASPDILKALIEKAANPDFTQLYHEKFSADLAADIKNKITEHFTNPDNIKTAREQALVAYAKTELAKKLNDAQLMELVNAHDANAVKDKINILLGVPNQGADLAGLPGAGVSKEIRMYAAIERVISDAKKPKDLAAGQNYELLRANINNFTFDPPVAAEIKALLANNPDLPIREKQRIQGHLLESLIRNYRQDLNVIPQPPELDNLTKLAKETNLERFQQLLVEKFALVDTSWVNTTTMEQVQKHACTRLIELGQKNPLQFGGQAHPKLIELIANLPLAKQRALLDNPNALSALAATRQTAEIDRVLALGDRAQLDRALVQAVAQENSNVLNLASIANGEIAKVLAQMVPPVVMTLEKVADINTLLLDPATGFDTADRNNAAIRAIVRILAPQPNADATYAAFGLDNVGAVLRNNRAQNLINLQHQNNANLIAAHNAPAAAADVKQVILALLPLSKNRLFPADRLIEEQGHKGIVTDIRKAKNLEEFRKLINTPPPRDYNDVFVPPLEKQLTAQAFANIKAAARAKAITDPALYQQILNDQYNEVKVIADQFKAMQLSIERQKQLPDLTKMNLTAWFHPALQASSKQNAQTYGPQLRELSRQCDAYVTNLTNKLVEVNQQLNSLPSTREYPPGNIELAKAVTNRRNSLLALATRISQEIEKYKRVTELFHGTERDDVVPMVKRGILKTLDEAIEGKLDSRLEQFNITAVDHDVSKKAELIRTPGTLAPREGAEVLKAGVLEAYGSSDSFITVNAVPEDKIREHTVTYKGAGGNPLTYIDPVTRASKPDLGRYIEERSAKNLSGQVESGAVNYDPSIRLTATQFPQNESARVFYAMALASQLVANLKSPPTAKSPIVVRGSDPELVKYLWTALMVIGENDENFKFGRDQIKVISGQFDPGSEYNLIGRWSSDCKQKFTNHPNLTSMLSGIREVNKHRFDQEEMKKLGQHAQDTSELTKFYRQNIRTVEEQNKAQEFDTRPTLGSSNSGS